MALQIDSITPTSITANDGETRTLSCEASGGLVPAGSFALKALPVSVERVYCLAQHENSIYVAVGYADGNADVYVSTDNCETYSLFLNTDDNAIHSIAIRDNGDVITTTSRDSNLSGRVLVNSTEIRGYATNSFTSFGIGKFANGNICVAIGDAGATTGGVLLIAPDNTVTQVLTTTKRATSFAVESNGTTGYTTDYTGRLWKTTNSGANWFEISRPVSSAAERCIVGILPNDNLLYYNTGSNVWLISTDGGVTFSAWGSAPSASYVPWAEIRTTTDGFVFGALGSSSVAVYNGTSWKYTIVGAGIDRIWGAPIVDGNYIYAGAGSGVDDGDVWRADLYTKTLRNATDNSVIGTGSPQDLLLTQALNGKDLRWDVTDGVTTVQSALIPVTVDALTCAVSPSEVEAVVGDEITLTATSNAGTATFQWFNGDEELAGETSNELIFVATLEDNGSNYYCVATYEGITVSSNIVVMVVSSASTALQHDTGKIIRGSIGSFQMTPIEKCYNDFSIKYGGQFSDLKISVSNVDQPTFPLISGDWTSYVSGIPSYNDAKDLWEIARNSFLLNSRIRTAPSDRSDLTYSSDRNLYFGVTNYDRTVEYGYQYTRLFVEWATRQKLTVKYDLPMTAENAKINIMDVVYFSDVLITPDNGEYGIGWVTSVQCDTKNDKVKIGIMFEAEFLQQPAIVEIPSDIVETGYSTIDIIETGSQADNAIEIGGV